jgi:hypothetical protein
MWTANLDVNDYPVEPPRPNHGFAQPMSLPRTSDRQIEGLQLERLLLDGEVQMPPLQQADLDSLVLMPVEPPSLPLWSIPKTNRLQTWQHVFGQDMPRIVTMYNCSHTQLAGRVCVFQWLTRIRSVRFILNPEDRYSAAHGYRHNSTKYLRNGYSTLLK